MTLTQLHQNAQLTWVWLFWLCTVYHFLHSPSPELGQSLSHASSQHKTVLLRRTSYSRGMPLNGPSLSEARPHTLSSFPAHDVFLWCPPAPLHQSVPPTHKGTEQDRGRIFCPFFVLTALLLISNVYTPPGPYSPPAFSRHFHNAFIAEQTKHANPCLKTQHLFLQPPTHSVISPREESHHKLCSFCYRIHAL